MRIIFRADAATWIGTGHIMRCMTLAKALQGQGAQCEFVCKEFSGSLIKELREKEFVVHTLPVLRTFTEASKKAEQKLPHSHWLDTNEVEDAEQCLDILSSEPTSWVVVDHYALAAKWEQICSKLTKRLMVIDDLADRPHHCDVLLDQTYGRQKASYAVHIRKPCQMLLGTKYALLRPEFVDLRKESLDRRSSSKVKNILISMGGIDQANATALVLSALLHAELPTYCEIKVVMGASAPWIEEVKQIANALPWEVEVIVNTSDMGRLMVQCDLAIGAAGATAWERCCLGVPTLLAVLAENQRTIASALVDSGAARLVELDVTKIAAQVNQLITDHLSLGELSAASAKLVDGKGAERAAYELGKI